LYYNLLLCYIQLDMHLRLICAIKFYLLTYLLTYYIKPTPRLKQKCPQRIFK